MVKSLPEPDVDVWVPTDQVLMPVEFVSPSSRRKDRIDKPALCAAAKIPYFMEVEVRRSQVRSEVKLFALDIDHYVEVAVAGAGSRFEIEYPFPLSFDPKELLPPQPR
nr:Uma2 family endonuclease [Saccharopolyspora erythraea]